MSYGFKGHLGIGLESIWGQPVNASDYFEALSESLTTDIERFEVRNIISGFHEPDDEAGAVRHAGDIVLAGHPLSMGYFLNGALGVNSVTTILSGLLFTNEFTPATADAGSLSALPSYTLEVFRDVTSSQQYAGVQFNTLELAVAPNQDVRMTVGVVARTRAALAATGPSFPGSPTGVFKFDTASMSIGGGAVNRIEAFTLRFENQLEGILALRNTAEVSRIKRTGPQLVRISGTVAFDDLTDFDAFIAQTEQQIVASFFKPNSFALVLDVPRAIFTAFPQQITGRDRLTVAFEMMGRYHTGSANAIKMSLTTTTSY